MGRVKSQLTAAEIYTCLRLHFHYIKCVFYSIIYGPRCDQNQISRAKLTLIPTILKSQLLRNNFWPSCRLSGYIFCQQSICRLKLSLHSPTENKVHWGQYLAKRADSSLSCRLCCNLKSWTELAGVDWDMVPA